MRTIRHALCVTLLVFALSSSAQTTDVQSPTPNRNLYTEAMTLRYDDLARDLTHTPAGLEHDVFAGVLADRTSRFDDSIRFSPPSPSPPKFPEISWRLC